ncbi:MAG: spermidine/putrescine ABC transporter permease [Spiroplasma sp.]
MKKKEIKNKKEKKSSTKKYSISLKKHSKLVRKLKKFETKIKAKATYFRFKSWTSLSYPYIFLMIFLIVLPLFIVLLYSLIVATNNAFIFRFTFGNFNDFFSESSFVMVLINSIIYSFFATVLAGLIGYPIAYIMAFKVSKLVAKNVWILVTLPIWINMLLRTIGLSIIFSILGEEVLIGTPIGIILAMTYMFLPFMILPIYNSLEKTDLNLLEASQDLGASSIKTFWRVTFRFSLPGVFSGFILMMLSAMTSLIVVKYIGGGKTVLISNIIESYFYRGANFALGAAISVILGIIVLIIIIVLKLLGRWVTGKKIWE